MACLDLIVTLICRGLEKLYSASFHSQAPDAKDAGDGATSKCSGSSN